MNDKNFEGRAAIVTGAASGIGLATVVMLARAGGTVALNYLPGDARGPEEVERLTSEGLDVIGIPGDVSSPEASQDIINRAINKLGRLDLLVNNAGTPGVREVVPANRLDLLTEDVWRDVLQTNLMGTFRCSRAAADALRKTSGAIVNTASAAAIHTLGSSMAYGASKAAVVSLTRNLARALSPEVRVNAVAPGLVLTPWQLENIDERIQATKERSLLKRVCVAEDVASLIVYLGVSADMVTGQTILIDGGFTLADPRS